MKTYRIAYVAQPSRHSVAQILDFCTEVRFVTTGYERDSDLFKTAAESLADYDPEVDVFVPVGSITANFMLGIFIERLREVHKFKFMNVAIYEDGEYDIRLLDVENVLEKVREDE